MDRNWSAFPQLGFDKLLSLFCTGRLRTLSSSHHPGAGSRSIGGGRNGGGRAQLPAGGGSQGLPADG